LRSRATLYCIGAHKDYGSIAPLFCALTGLISDTAKRLAQQNRFGRLDPPVLFALDEAPNVVPLPLHRLTSEARGLGITFVVCVRSRQQVDDVWTSTRGSIIWKNCKVKMTLPVANDGETLDLVSKLCGTYEAERRDAVERQGGQRVGVDRHGDAPDLSTRGDQDAA
jgi:type IV secretion system protein VirD4